VAGYILRWFAHAKTVINPSTRLDNIKVSIITDKLSLLLFDY